MLKKHQTIAYGRQSVLQQLTFLQPLTSLLPFPSLGVGGRVHRVLPPCGLKDTGYVQKLHEITKGEPFSSQIIVAFALWQAANSL